MRTYLTRRILQIIPVFLGILFILFVIMELAPGGPTSTMMDPRMTAEQKAILAERLDPKLPVYQKFINWIEQALRGNFGFSIRHKKPVASLLGDFIGPTFLLAMSALVLSMLIGIPVGILSATRQRSLADTSATVFSLIGISMPTFFFGLLLLKFLAVDLRLFPLFGMRNMLLRKEPWLTRTLDVAWHTVLPAVVLGLSSTASFMRYTRSSMLEVIRQDYIRTARAKGLREKIVIYRHAFRNAVIPIVTLLGFWVPGLLSGAVMTETVFGFPGLGKVSIDAVNTRDYPVILGVNAMLAMLTLIGTLIADILYAVADPRIKYE
ncbi:MAG: ABC transporter permease [Clostridia bacterium]|nr:ABC transporter permease [Clostridia bacterium]